MVALIVDIQYYPVNGTHVIKEASVISLTSENYHHFVFKNLTFWHDLSTKDRETARFISEDLGCLHYNCGLDVLQNFIDNISCDALIIVNGHIKKKMLRKIFPHNRIVDIKVPFYSLTCSKKCSFPSYHTQCSLTNCLKIKSFL